MPSLGGLLSVARSALIAQQAGMAVVGHNVANAQTAGYTRQTAQLSTTTPEGNALGVFGTGVTVATVSRIRDVLLDQQVRQQASPAAGFAAQSSLLGSVESIFGEPSDTGLASSLDAFWNSWSDLAADPSNSTAKVVVQQRGTAVTETFNRYASQLADLDTSTRGEIADTVSAANRLIREIAAVNAEITPAEAGGHTANDLRDERDRLIDELSKLVPVTVIDRSNGADQVMVGGTPLVDGSVAKTLTLGSGIPLTVAIGTGSDSLRAIGGTLGAMLDFVNTGLPVVASGLDALASALVGEVNALHVTGWSPPSGVTGNWDPAAPPTGSGVNFFDALPANGTARNIRLSAPVAADAAAIAAGSMLDAPGDNSLALALAGLRDFAATAPGQAFGTGYQSLIGTVASQKAAAASSAMVYGTLAEQAQTHRLSADAVSTDEELISLMGFQQAYSAAAKIVQTVDLMMQTLLDLKR